MDRYYKASINSRDFLLSLYKNYDMLVFLIYLLIIKFQYKYVKIILLYNHIYYEKYNLFY